jgi:type II secretory pathway component GspD/PulD (secretin)
MKKNTNKLLLALAILSIAHSASAQTESVEVVVSENKPAGTVIVNPAPAQAGEVSADAANDTGANAGQSNPIEAEEGGFLIKDANINDIFQLLAKRSDKQYFHNNKLNTVDFQVTGHLNGDVEPLKQMEELAFQYGLRMYVKGNTVYAMMSDQLSNLPAKEWTYSLKYLRPTDIEQIKALIQPMLSVGRGIVNYEPKTNTIIVIDTMRHIEMVEKLLKKIDKPKGQIVVEVKILRVNNNVGESKGVDWSASLGESGTSLELSRSLNSVFGLPSTWDSSIATESFIGGGAQSTVGADVPALTNNIILSPLQLSGVLRALNEGNFAH